MPVIKLKSENDALKILNTELKAKIASLEMQISCFRDLNSDPEPQQILMKNLREKVSDLEEQLTILQTNSVKLIDALQKSQRDNYKMQEKIVDKKLQEQDNLHNIILKTDILKNHFHKRTEESRERKYKSN